MRWALKLRPPLLVSIAMRRAPCGASIGGACISARRADNFGGQEFGIMIATRFAALHLVTSTCTILFFAAHAAAQDTRFPQARTTGSAVDGPALTSPQAPVGHRQPRLSDLPPESRDAPIRTQRSQRDREFDKILQICRGC
jgi:hypothetical protein